MKGKQNNIDPLTIKQKNERFHFLIKGTGYILLYGAIMILIGSIIIAASPNSELSTTFEIIGFVLFSIWMLMAIPFLIYGKYDRNIFSKIFWITLFFEYKIFMKKTNTKINKYIQENKNKK